MVHISSQNKFEIESFLVPTGSLGQLPVHIKLRGQRYRNLRTVHYIIDRL
jgi:hypothetical protein